MELNIRKLFSKNLLELHKYRKLASSIEQLQNNYKNYSESDFKKETLWFRERLVKGETLDHILPEAYALACEAIHRLFGFRLHTVQIMGAISLHGGNIAEMKTGEGKTVTAVLPVYLNALSGDGVHVVTVNDYLVKRDAEEMKPVYTLLGLSVGINASNSKLSKSDKRAAYNCDVTYTTSSELGFDYLRDNLETDISDRVQRTLNYAVIDEVDSVLLDEAKTPLIISGGSLKSGNLYFQADYFVKSLHEDTDYMIDIPTKAIALTELGIEKAESIFKIRNLYSNHNIKLVHHIDQALKANYTMEKNIDYVVNDDEVQLVDSFTGRILIGRRFSHGLHQALEAKENVTIKDENKTLATITFQNFFRMYSKLSGMTGTGKTEELEFQEVYNMTVHVIPTNKPILRFDDQDLIFATLDSKFHAVVKEIQKRYAIGQPVLVGTVSIESSERLSRMLTNVLIPHHVLNAKSNQAEAEIIKLAGQKYAVTVATNMAGRGTDIKLTQEVRDLGGLCVIGTERHDNRRIDNQLRGRSGRQGEPGYSRFYISLEDELLVRRGGEQIKKLLKKLKVDAAPIESKMLSRYIESAQLQVEGNNYDDRLKVLQYDNVIAEQRRIIYNERTRLLKMNGGLSRYFEQIIRRTLNKTINDYWQGSSSEKIYELLDNLQDFSLVLSSDQVHNLESKTQSFIERFLAEQVLLFYRVKKAQLGEAFSEDNIKLILLSIIDEEWTAHIDLMEITRQSIGMRAYAQNIPLIEYQRVAFEQFKTMIQQIETKLTLFLLQTY
ncbi:preprotein translocase subunit SecA [Streptococcus constellatus]|uniref:preprotein translocase subunit SecA n=1 Tax=Streptococcus constellatus TaxID=76860 RepID=UPI002103CBD5|nr:preprotein translocase subunit SecA [Streptococcus constellatus]UTX63829.1 preprotein translocase subunit SecA [Streptococcus constellatus]UTX65545.1 preprotein translocase subunit SecA [Streptococcus constellatus]